MDLYARWHIMRISHINSVSISIVVCIFFSNIAQHNEGTEYYRWCFSCLSNVTSSQYNNLANVFPHLAHLTSSYLAENISKMHSAYNMLGYSHTPGTIKLLANARIEDNKTSLLKLLELLTNNSPIPSHHNHWKLI